MFRLSIVWLVLSSPCSLAADWPQWRGTNRDGISPETGLLKSWPKEGPKLVWQANIGGAGYGCPVIVGERIYITGAEDDLKGQREFALCLKTQDGTTVWKKELPGGEGRYNTDWGSGPRSTPTVDGEYLYVLGARGDLSCLKTSDGTQVWAVNLVKDFGGGIPNWGYSESILIDGDKLVCTPGGQQGSLLALDKRTGKKIWQSTELKDGAAYASIIAADVAGTRQYITQTSAAAVGVEAATGKLLWRVNQLQRAVAVIPTPVVHDDLAFFTSGYGAGCELLKIEKTGAGEFKATPLYTKNTVLSNHHGGVIRVGDYIYGHSDTGNQWVCIEYKKKDDDLIVSTGKFEKGSVIAAEGLLYLYGQSKGTMTLVEATTEKWTEKGRFEIPEKSKFPRRSGLIWTHPVIAHGKLYLRDHEMLFCYDITDKKP
jgi:outer membrane protein assembly factor BamB